MDLLDHVLLGVRDLEAAADRLRREWGLGTLPGGSPGPGVVNAIVPLEPPTYLELVTVTDAGADPAAARLAAAIAGGDRLFTWAIEPEDLDARAVAAGLEPSGSAGDTGQWRVLGEVGAAAPFFIEYGTSRDERSEKWRHTYARAAHDCAPGRVSWLEVGGNEPDLRRWIGEIDVPVRFAGGGPRLSAVAITTARGEVVLR